MGIEEKLKHNWNSIVMILLIFLTAVLCLLNYDVPFVYDDLEQIRDNIYIRDFFNFKKIASDELRSSRFIQNLTFSFNWMVSQDSPWSYHLFNNILHFFNTFLAFFFLGQLGISNRYITTFACVIFFLHPLQVESVTYVMGRVELLKTFVTLSLLILYLRKKENYFLIYLIFGLSLLIKETVVLVVFLFVAIDVFIKNKKITKNLVLKYLFYISHVLLFFVLKNYINFNIHNGLAGFSLYPFSEYLLSNMYYLVFYLYLFINPSEQSIFHEWIQDPPILGVALGIGLYLFMIIFLIRNYRKKSIVSFMLIFFIMSFCPNNSIMQFINPFAEYRLYQSNLVLGFIISYICFKNSDRIKSKIVFISGLILYFSFFHFLYIEQWKSPEDLWRFAKYRYPNSVTINTNLANYSLSRGLCKQAFQYYQDGCSRFENIEMSLCDHHLALINLLMDRPLESTYYFNKLRVSSTRRRDRQFYNSYLLALNAVGNRTLYDQVLSKGKLELSDSFSELSFNPYLAKEYLNSLSKNKCKDI